jgi:hypothetical protein
VLIAQNSSRQRPRRARIFCTKSGIDPLTVSRRIGHANVSTTLNIYAHEFAETDAAAAKAIDAALKG